MVFDADNDVTLGTVSIPSYSTVGDFAMTADQAMGFVTTFNFTVYVLDLTTTPPSLASGTNPITISNYGEDIAMTMDGQFLVVNDGSASQPISVIDVASRTEISTFTPSGDPTLCSDVLDNAQNVLAGGLSYNVRLLEIDSIASVCKGSCIIDLEQPHII